MSDRGLLRNHWGLMVSLFRVLDVLLIAGAYAIVRQVHPEIEPWRELDTNLLILSGALFAFAAQSQGLYGQWRGTAVTDELVRVWTTWMLVIPALLLMGFVMKLSDAFSRVVILLWFLLTPALHGGARFVLRSLLGEARRNGRNTRTTAIIGATELAERLARQVAEPQHGMRLVGVFDDRIPERCHPIPEEFAGIRGSLVELIELARAGEVDLVYIALPLRAEPRIVELSRQLADTTATVYMAADFDAFDLLYARWSNVGPVPVVSIHETPFYGVAGTLKRIEDMVLGSIIMAIISLPMLVISIGVKLTSKGPIFFKQRRYGLNGDVIDVLKFRSMTVAEDGKNVQQATRHDARITPFGAFLRRTSLDELPQFINVLTGQMSIVGPRPHAVAHNELYRGKIRGYMLRHKVKPGITGWAQVNGWRGETDTLEKMEKRIEHDLAYIRNWDLIWDLKIIFLTVFGSAVRRNAY